ncbi:tRNA1(Val) A37 N6-methylase TrmN6 [Rhodoblastus acidophilus]|uniref:tRNA1(Val) (adenine(37)-N6)-methyltransferase n=1 Tax=Rhodoblastus acidophilus TaxID=1074 RepID=UPI00222482EB|nr:methyltransferase [Rhodoblastus acidophilus]MCW2283643.1 tRNA1(Val) A37 N6-methylase TrmN6 [Rhodoblastus acidophilus]MCW2332503.1 tRNA1(Val) A37 N6-methylase TrmN6 [Rhodoblastus acidophilus]
MPENSSPDLLLGGRIKLFQRTGHRVGTDAVLLAAAAPALPSGLIVDVGAGAGFVGLALALANPEARVVLLEKNSVAAEDARRNIEANFFAERAEVLQADLFDASARKAAGLVEAADLVVTNPPFLEARASRASPDADRAMAHVLGEGGLALWLKAALALLRPGGVFVLIHRADALGEILAGLGGRLGGLEIVPIFPRAGSAAIRVVVRGRKGSKAPLALLPGLVLHGEDGAFTPVAEAIHRHGRKLFDQ